MAIGLALMGMLAVSGCSPREPEPVAMVPQATAQGYGYSEKRLAPDRYQVTFVSPPLCAGRDAAEAHRLADERQQVYDPALWRAAELTLEKGFRAFIIERDSRDVDVTSRREPVFLPGGPTSPYFEAYNRHWPYAYWPGYWRGYWSGDPFYMIERTRTAGRITVNLTIELLLKPTGGALDAAATAERLRKAYGSFSFSEAEAGD